MEKTVITQAQNIEAEKIKILKCNCRRPKSGPSEEFGHDMVKLTFNDGSKVITQKALFEAANELGAFESISSQKNKLAFE